MTAPQKQANFTKYQPFVKWVGGKRGLSPQVAQFVYSNFKVA